VALVDRLRVEQALGATSSTTRSSTAPDRHDHRGRYTRASSCTCSTRGLVSRRTSATTRFKAFTRATPSGNGSGLGLAIVETVARAHDGAAGAKVRPDGGADVWIRLPL
jgi:C4-dicarboxylate-specific signal transduction histidine kinase